MAVAAARADGMERALPLASNACLPIKRRKENGLLGYNGDPQSCYREKGNRGYGSDASQCSNQPAR